MMSRLLGEGANAVGEGQRVGEVREVEDSLEPGDAVALQQLPGGDFAPELRDLRLGHLRRVTAAGDTPFGGQRAHRAHLSSPDPRSFEGIEKIIRGLQVSCAPAYAR